MAWFAYLARCRDGSLYCGITKDLAARVLPLRTPGECS